MASGTARSSQMSPARREHTQRVIRQVDFPPAKSLAGRGRKPVMIVVPTLAERQ